MKNSRTYPAWLLEERLLINEYLAERIDAAFDDEFLSAEVKKCVLPGRKVRSILFLNTLRKLRPNMPMGITKDIIFSIELSHAASVLIDDVIDCDQYRHGFLSTETQWGQTKSILFAHLMTSAAIGQLVKRPSIQHKLVGAYGLMTEGEMHDVFIPNGNWIYDGYDHRTYQKTSVLFGFAFSAAQDVAGSKLTRLRLSEIGRELGLLYQLSNDFYDWQPTGIQERHAKGQSWPITFSYPLASYMQKFKKKRISRYLGKRVLTHDEWLEFLAIVWHPDIKSHCEREIARVQQSIQAKISRRRMSNSLKELYLDFVQLIATEDFWYHVYPIY